MMVNPTNDSDSCLRRPVSINCAPNLAHPSQGPYLLTRALFHFFRARNEWLKVFRFGSLLGSILNVVDERGVSLNGKKEKESGNCLCPSNVRRRIQNGK